MTVISNNGNGVNFRLQPAGSIVRVLADGTPVTLVSFNTIAAMLDGVQHIWQAVCLLDYTLGWVASEFLSAEGIKPPPPASGRELIGFHALQDASNTALQFMRNLNAIPLCSATVVNDPALANQLSARVNGSQSNPLVKYVLARN